MLKMTTD